MIETVTLHRIFNEHYMCGEHRDGELPYLSDALGTDCMIEGGADANAATGFLTLFRGDGSHNEDWYGWNADVLAPFDGRIAVVHVNAVINQPGHSARAPASIIIFERADG